MSKYNNNNIIILLTVILLFSILYLAFNNKTIENYDVTSTIKYKISIHSKISDILILLITVYNKYNYIINNLNGYKNNNSIDDNTVLKIKNAISNIVIEKQKTIQPTILTTMQSIKTALKKTVTDNSTLKEVYGNIEVLIQPYIDNVNDSIQKFNKILSSSEKIDDLKKYADSLP